MGRRPVDPGWKIFENQLKAARTGALSAELGISAVDVTEMKAGRRRPSFADIPSISAALYQGDPTALAARMGIVPSAHSLLRDLVRASNELHRVEEQLAKAQSMSSDLVDAALSNLVAKTASDGRWAVAIWPGVEGVAPYRLHYRDRLDFRRTDGELLDIGETRRHLGALLDAAGAEPGTALPRWDDGPSPTRGNPQLVSHWVVPRLARESHPVDPIPLNHAESVIVISTTATARPDAVGAILSRVLGYGYTSAQILARRLYGGDITDTHLTQRAELHRQWVEHPHSRMVWSHFGRNTVERDMLQSSALVSKDNAAVVWLYESDQVLNQKAGPTPRTPEKVALMAAARDSVDAELATPRIIRVPLRPHAAPVNTAEANDQKMDESLRVVSVVLSDFIKRGWLASASLQRRLMEMGQNEGDDQSIAEYLQAATHLNGA